uniref:Transmembrane protein n=1 Tax=Plectus sambesii TaxID=2011161 RepID=A0A914WJI8_9BILA
MTVIPCKQARACLDVFSFVLCLLLIVLQLGLLDYYFLTNLSEKWWYAWIAADALVIIIMIWILVLALRYNQRSMEELCTADAKVKYAWVGWLAYALVLVGKVATCFQLFYDELPAKAGEHDKLFNDHLLRLCLSLSVLIFLFLLEAHHYTHLLSHRQLYITYLVTAICLDLIDTIYFLDLLWQSLQHNWNIELWLECVILALACFNLVLPGFALMKLRFSKFPKSFVVGEKVWALLYVLAVNAPFLGIRIYLYVLLEVPKQNIHYDPKIPELHGFTVQEH